MFTFSCARNGPKINIIITVVVVCTQKDRNSEDKREMLKCGRICNKLADIIALLHATVLTEVQYSNIDTF